MSEKVVIDRRFRGPPESGNGGYSCGVVAAGVDAPIVEATLRVPPPLDHTMERRRAAAGAELYDGDTLVAEARAVPELDFDVPEPVGFDVAEAARRDSPLHDHSVFPMCFVCGPNRGVGDGLQVICGPVEGRDAVAAPGRLTARYRSTTRARLPRRSSGRCWTARADWPESWSRAWASRCSAA